MMNIGDFIDMIMGPNSIRVCVLNETTDVYQFNVYDIPYELGYMKIHSIDNPEYYEHVVPLTVNIELDEFDDYNAFKKEFESYLV